MEARRFSRRFLARRTWKHWIVLGFLGLIASCSIGLLTYVATSPSFDLDWQAWTTILVTIGVFMFNALTTLSAEAVFLGGTAVLFVTGILTEQDGLAGLSNPRMITIAVLYIVVTGLSQT